MLSDQGFVFERLRRYDMAVNALERATALAEGLGEWLELATLCSNLASVYGRVARLELARRHARRALALNPKFEQREGVLAGVTQMHAGLYDFQAGDFGSGIRDLEAAVGCFERAGAAAAAHAGIAENHLIHAWIQLGQTARALTLLLRGADSLPAWVLARRIALRGRLLRFCELPAHDWQAGLPAERVDPHVQVSVDTERARGLEPEAALVMCDSIIESCGAVGFISGAMNARLARLDAPRQLAPEQAGDEAAALCADLRRLQPNDGYRPDYFWVAGRAFAAAGREAESRTAFMLAHRWIVDTALPRVPLAFRESFLQRNVVNRGVLAAARASANSPITP